MDLRCFFAKVNSTPSSPASRVLYGVMFRIVDGRILMVILLSFFNHSIYLQSLHMLLRNYLNHG